MKISGSTPFDFNRVSDISGSKSTDNVRNGNVRQTSTTPEKRGIRKDVQVSPDEFEIPSEPSRALSTQEKKMLELLFPDGSLLESKGPLKAYDLNNKQETAVKQSSRRLLGNSIDLYV